jgi:hypothetical protein
MIFLVKYDRSRKRLESLKPYDDESRAEANRDRLEAELQQFGQEQQKLEVVLIDAPDESRMRETHAHYFQKFQVVEPA